MTAVMVESPKKDPNIFAWRTTVVVWAAAMFIVGLFQGWIFFKPASNLQARVHQCEISGREYGCIENSSRYSGLFGNSFGWGECTCLARTSGKLLGKVTYPNNGPDHVQKNHQRTTQED